MKRLATAVAVAGLIGTPAFAADIALKAPPPALAPVYNWTGLYVGVNAGASFGNANTDFNVDPVTLEVHATAIGGNGPFSTSLASTSPAFAGSDRTYPSGFMGGGQIGYNWQVSPIWVAGFEADFQGALERDSSIILTNNFSAPDIFCTSPGGPPATGCTSAGSSPGSTTLSYQTKIDWFGTVRGRIGYVWGNGNVMSYLTGGLAYGRVEAGGTFNTSLPAIGIGTAAGTATTPAIPSGAFGHSQVNTGWVVGYGTEGVIDFWGARNWTWKIESLYMDLGHLDTVTPGFSLSTGTATLGASTTGGGATTHTHFTDGILRAGLNYKFY